MRRYASDWEVVDAELKDKGVTAPLMYSEVGKLT